MSSDPRFRAVSRTERWMWIAKSLWHGRTYTIDPDGVVHPRRRPRLWLLRVYTRATWRGLRPVRWWHHQALSHDLPCGCRYRNFTNRRMLWCSACMHAWFDEQRAMVDP